MKPVSKREILKISRVPLFDIGSYRVGPESDSSILTDQNAAYQEHNREDEIPSKPRSQQSGRYILY